MPPHPPRLQPLLDRLPFALSDVEAANEAFQRWRQAGSRRDADWVELWTYCYVTQYFFIKSMRDDIQGVSDVDALVSRSYDKVKAHRDGIRDPGRYAHWVSVVCKNRFLNYVDRVRTKQSIDDDRAPPLPDPQAQRPFGDVGLVYRVLAEAIERLPEYLRETARMFFLEDRSFVEISEATGKSVDTVRAYKHKAVKRLRNDDEIRAVLHGPDL